MLKQLSESQAAKVREKFREHPLYEACWAAFTPRLAAMDGLVVEVEDVFCQTVYLIDDLITEERPSQTFVDRCWTELTIDVRRWKNDVSVRDRQSFVGTTFHVASAAFSLHWQCDYSFTLVALLQNTLERETKGIDKNEEIAIVRRLADCALALSEWFNDYADSDDLLSDEIDAIFNQTIVKKDRTKKKTTFKPSSSSFDYKCPQRSCNAKLTHFYQDLLKLKWIHSETKPDDFLDLFTNKQTTCRIKWMVSEAILVSLIKQLVDKAYLTVPTGQTWWGIVWSHFVDAKGRLFSERPNYHEPKKAHDNIAYFVEILAPSA